VEGQRRNFAPDASIDAVKEKSNSFKQFINTFITPRCLVCYLTGESRRLRPRRTAKRSVEARRVALREKKSKSSPLRRWATTPRGYCWDATFGHRPKAHGPFGTNDKVFSRPSNLSDRRALGFERREAKTKAPTAKTKASEERRRPRRPWRSRRQRGDSARVDGEALRGAARKGVGERARLTPRRPNSPNDDMCLWAQWAVEARM
jgi:hypothetical protein